MKQVYFKIIQKKREISIVLILTLLLGILPTIAAERCEVKAAGLEYEIGNPRINNDGVTTWDCVWFGKYWQNDTNDDGNADQNDEKEPIKWRVLSVNGSDAFLLADCSLEKKRFHESDAYIVWAQCTLRQWLNNDFYDEAFNEEEKTAINTTLVINEDNPYWGVAGGEDTLDKIYIPSFNEMINSVYGFSESTGPSKTREAFITAYLGQSVLDQSYWLRTPWNFNKVMATVSYGSVNYFNYVDFHDYVRPVLHLDLSSTSSWSYAGTVNSEGKEIETATPEPTEFFRLGSDNNSFVHCWANLNTTEKDQYFCNKVATYKTESKYLNRLSNGIFEYLALLKKSWEQWNGSCYGISLGMLLNKADKLDLNSFGVNDFYSIQPYTNIAARKYINFLYLSQVSSKYNVGKMTGAMTRSDGTGDFTEKEFLEKFINEVKKGKENRIPVMFLYATRSGGHAIIATSIKEESDRYLVTMYDMNTVSASSSEGIKGQFLVMEIEKDYSGFVYKNDYGIDIASNYTELRYLNTSKLLSAPFGNISNITKSSQMNNGSDTDTEATIIINDNTEITNSNSDILKYANGTLSGDMELSGSSPIYRYINNEENSVLDYLVQIPVSDSYLIESQNQNIDITLYDDNKFVAVNGNDIERITTDVENIIVEGNRADYNISLPSNNDNFSLYELDIISDDAIFNYEGDNLKITSETGISNVKVSACRDMDYLGEKSVSIIANEIEIVPNKNEVDKAKIIASNKDGETEITTLTIEQLQEDEKEELVSTPSPTPNLVSHDENNTTTNTKANTKTNTKINTSAKKSVKKNISKPKKVKLQYVSAMGKGKVAVIWKWFTSQNGFQLQYAQNRKFSKKKKMVRKNSYTSVVTLKKLKRGKTYYFRVRAYNKSGSKKKYGKWSNIKKIKIK